VIKTKKSTIKHKLLLIIMLTSGLALMVASVGFVINDLLSLRKSMEKQFSTLADIVGTNSTAALSFDDVEGAHDVLRAVEVEPAVLWVRLIGQDGRVFASFPKDKTSVTQEDHNTLIEESEHVTASLFGERVMDIYRPIKLDNEIVGMVHIRVDMNVFFVRLSRYAGIVLALLFISFMAALLISSRLQRIISDPITNLSDVARRVSSSENYSIRAEKHSNDEIGALVDGFNDMLDQIQIRDNKLRHYSETLESEVESRTSDLNKTNIDLKHAITRANEAARVKSEFLANMSHEIRTPMNGVIGMLELLSMDELNTDQKDMVDIAASSAMSLLALLNDILDFSKIESGQLTLEAIEFNVCDFVEEVVALSNSDSRKNKKVETISYIDSTVPEIIVGDPLRLRQILTNLLSNAIKFTEEGEIVVNVRAKKINDQSITMYFEVKDTGIGIPKEDQQRIFSSFVQADGSTTRKYGGTGLGLMISKQLVEMMHGELFLKSELGHGSTFYFSIPISLGSTCSTFDTEKLIDQRAWIIDENETLRSVLASYLQEWGMKVELLKNKDLDFSHLETDNKENITYPDIIIAGDGLELSDVQHLAELNIPIIGLSKRVCMFHPLAYLVEKPVRRQQLRKQICDTLFSQEKIKADMAVPIVAVDETYPGRALIADDNEGNRKVAERMLATLGVQAELVCDGAEAIDLLNHKEFDIIFMDVQMPGMDGFQATKIIRNLEINEQRKRTPIVAMTANAMKGD